MNVEDKGKVENHGNHHHGFLEQHPWLLQRAARSGNHSGLDCTAPLRGANVGKRKMRSISSLLLH